MITRVRRHADLSSLYTITYVRSVCHLIGKQAKNEFLRKIAHIKKELKVCVSDSAICATMGYFMALHLSGGLGYRGAVAPLSNMAEAISLSSEARVGQTTLKNTLRVLAAAGYIQRGTVGRGHFSTSLGVRRQVSVVTLTGQAMDLMAAKRVGKCASMSHTVVNNATQASFDRSSKLDNSRREYISRARGKKPGQDVSRPPAGSHEEARLATHAGGSNNKTARSSRADSQAPKAPSQGRRQVPRRPRRDAPNTYAYARQAFLFDAETLLRRRGAPHHTIQRLIAETSPSWRGVTSFDSSAIWSWRDMEQTARYEYLRAIVFPNLKHTRRRRVEMSFEEGDYRISAKAAWAPAEPGPERYPAQRKKAKKQVDSDLSAAIKRAEQTLRERW